MTDDIRPRGTVQVLCDLCGYWSFWVDALDLRLPDGPFWCDSCHWSSSLAAGIERWNFKRREMKLSWPQFIRYASKELKWENALPS